MGGEPVIIVGSAVVTALALWAFLSFGLFRHRGNQLVWAAAGIGGGSAGDAGEPLDPDIARRIASLLRDDPAPYDADPASQDAVAAEIEADLELADAATADPGTFLAPSDDHARADASATPSADDPWADDPSADDPVAAPDAEKDAEAADPGLARVDPEEMLRRLLEDHVTGLGSRFAWDRWVADEEARERRYRRPTTLVVVEVTGLDAVTAFFGSDAAVRVVTEVADIVRANVRTSDHAALVGPARFAIMLPETDEVRAVNFVERVRAACDRWLESNAPTVGIGFGWASPGASSDLSAARAVADRRLAADLRDAATGTSRP